MEVTLEGLFKGIMPPRESLCVALDTAEMALVRGLISALCESVSWFKVGLTLFVAHGWRACEAVLEARCKLFLDLKLHDIPTQVAGAVRGAGRLGAGIVTVHTAGGPKMLRAAVEAREEGLKVIGVTVLTSLDKEDFSRVWPGTSILEQTKRLVEMAVECGLDGAVVSPLEVREARRFVPRGFMLVVPGLRSPSEAKGDQGRTGSPFEALRDGADLLVLGRSVTQAPDPLSALKGLFEEP